MNVKKQKTKSQPRAKAKVPDNGLDLAIIKLTTQLADSKLEEALKVCSFGTPACTVPKQFRTMTMTYKQHQLLGVFAFCEEHDPEVSLTLEDVIDLEK